MRRVALSSRPSVLPTQTIAPAILACHSLRAFQPLSCHRSKSRLRASVDCPIQAELPLAHSIAKTVAICITAAVMGVATCCPTTLAASAPPYEQPDTHKTCNPQVDLAGLFGGNEQEEDAVEPFTMFGYSSKKYVIEELQGDKILSRKRGFTVNTCVGVLSAAAETPEFQGLSMTDKVAATGNQQCTKAEATDLKPACTSSCNTSCGTALDGWSQESNEKTGIPLGRSDRERLIKSCLRQCNYECSKPGRVFDFVVPYRK